MLDVFTEMLYLCSGKVAAKNGIVMQGVIAQAVAHVARPTMSYYCSCKDRQ